MMRTDLRWRGRFLCNYEGDCDAVGRPFVAPLAVLDGLAVYACGDGPAALVFPYPHADTVVPMAQDALADAVAGLGRRVISFDPPGAFRSTRSPQADMAEMLQCAQVALEVAGAAGPVDVVGHSMGGLCALAFAIQVPTRVRRLVLVGSVSGFPAAVRWGMPGSCWRSNERAYWQCTIWGTRLMFGLGNLALHKQLINLMTPPCFVDRSLVELLPILPDDKKRGVPIRHLWSRNVWRRLDYVARLKELRATTLICAGRHDPMTPLACNLELRAGIPDARLVIFERSGHAPFIEEPQRFAAAVGAFLMEERLS